MELLNDWKIATQQGGNFDLYHFHTLFHWNFTQADVELMLEEFEEKEDLVSRLMNYKDEKISCSNDEMLELVKRDVTENHRLCKEIEYGSEIVDVFHNLEYKFVNEEEFLKFSEDLREPSILKQIIGDHLIYATKDRMQNDWLLEAYYGLTTESRLVWYLGKPLYESTFNPDLYFDIWKNSGDYYLGGGKVYILNGGGDL